MKSPHTSTPKGGARGRPRRIKGGGPPSGYPKKGVCLGVCKVDQPNLPAENATWGHAKLNPFPTKDWLTDKIRVKIVLIIQRSSFYF